MARTRHHDHPSDRPPARDRRIRWAAIGAAIAVSLGAGGIGGLRIASADLSDGARPVFIPLTPCRLIDTRPGNPNVGPRDTPLGIDETIAINARGENGECTGTSAIPADATALQLNVTALKATEQTFLTFWGNGDNPGTSALNPAPGQPPTPNAVTTPLATNGTFNLYNERGTVDVVIDISGYYVNHDHDDIYFRKTQLYTQQEVDALLSPLLADLADLRTASAAAIADITALETDVAAQNASIASVQADIDDKPDAPVLTRLAYRDSTTSGTNGQAQIRQVGTFTKTRADSLIRLDWTSFVSKDVSSTTTQCRFHFRIDGAVSEDRDSGAGVDPGVEALVRIPEFDVPTYYPISLTDVFEGLSVGQHTVTLWVDDEGNECRENSGNYDRTVFVTELPS